MVFPDSKAVTATEKEQSAKPMIHAMRYTGAAGLAVADLLTLNRVIGRSHCGNFSFVGE